MDQISSYNDAIKSYIDEYVDSPSSMNQRKYNIKIVYEIVEKLKQIKQYTPNDYLDFSGLKTSSQTLKNNILEEVSIRIMMEKKKYPYPICNYPKEYICPLLAIGAEITDKVDQNLFAFYTEQMYQSKQNTENVTIEHYIKQANKVRGFLKPGRILPEIEQKLDNLNKKIDKLQEQTTKLQNKADSINNKVTRIEDKPKQCCTIL